ncbi:MAG TPA: discoidin domain-containing protein [Euzebyales bacterium]|nr:discoidin domain-containing protein [Euzebyales bacterium]
MSCQACGVASVGGQFCVACGQPLSSVLTSTATAVTTREREQPRSTWLAFQEIRLLACPRCGAPNSAARWQCARCGETFDDRADDEPSVEVTPPVEDAPPVQPESAPWVALVTVVVGVAAVAVAVAMLASRGVGPFGPQAPAAPVPQAAQAKVAKVRASSTAADSAARLVSDQDPATAWRTEGEGKREWVELRLQAAVKIDHLLVWNGDQSSNRSFIGTNRVRDVTIVFPDADKRYTASFPNRNANFRVDMPEPPVARRIRIRIRSVYGDNPQAALSEIEALVNSSTTPAE